jgi:uncharacterized membrane protein HdeD (DUF308 family)
MMMLVGNWWAFVLRGIFAIIFGVLTFLWPGMALLTLVLLFGAYAIVDGVFNIVASFRATGAGQQRWWVLLLEGIVSIIAGLVAFFMPGLTALALLYLIAAWAVVTGALEIAAAIRLRRQIRGEWLLALAGVLSIVFGVLLFLFPGPGALAVVLWIGAYAIAFGVLLIVLGVRLRRWERSVENLGHGFPVVAPGH